MKIVLKHGGIALLEAENCSAFSVEISLSMEQARVLLEQRQAGELLSEQQASIRQAFILQLAGKLATQPNWLTAFQQMLAYAQSRDWLTPDGQSILGHIVWLLPGAGETPVPLPPPRSTPYGLLRADGFTGDGSLPQQADAVVIGGGICGVLTAWFLAQEGISVLLCEKAELACESSSRAFGWVAELLTSPEKVALAQASKALWHDLQAQLGDIGYREHGIAYLAESEEELQEFAGWLGQVRGIADPRTRLLDADEVAERYPELKQSFAGAIYSPSDGSVEPVIAATRIAQAARDKGVRICTSCAVRGLDIHQGKVAGVFTEKGYVRTTRVLSAVNTWSRILCGNHGVDVPQLYTIMSMGRIGRIDGPQGSGGVGRWAWRRQIDGGYSLGLVDGMCAPATRDAMRLFLKFRPLMKMLGGVKVTFGRDTWQDWRIKRRWDPQGVSPFERHRVLSGTLNKNIVGETQRRMADVLPGMAAAEVAESWCGPLALTPDNMPIASAVEQIAGFYLITGCGYGLTWGPELARIMSCLMLGRDPGPLAARMRLSRFSDGSKLELAP